MKDLVSTKVRQNAPFPRVVFTPRIFLEGAQPALYVIYPTGKENTHYYIV